MSTAKASDIDAPQPMPASAMLPEIEAALVERGMDPAADIILNDEDKRIPGAAGIAHTSYSAASGRFLIRLTGGQTITGAARLNQLYPVLIAPVARGELIDEGNVHFMESADYRAGAYLTDMSAVIGKEARRPLLPGRPLRTGDITAPTLVEKGALVTLYYSVNGLRLTHSGVALGAGGAGDIISVKNVQSERTLKAVVEATGKVRVASASPEIGR